jgi:alpha-N-arabinofuranosidase
MKARVVAHRDFVISNIDERIYSSFLEHVGRAIYTGIYEPDHPTADANGMRSDVVQLVRDLNIPFVRYPGGNFVSSYNWEDGIGPREKRPTRLDPSWHSSDSNAVGIHEFFDWCQSAGTEPMMVMNLGSRGLEAARDLLEYVTAPTGSYWGDLRKANGRAEPFPIKLWGLGCEMDGGWQFGQKSADEYGMLSRQVAQAIRKYDKTFDRYGNHTTEIVVNGSTSCDMPGYPDWDRTVLEHCYEHVDYIAAHMYFSSKTGQRYSGFPPAPRELITKDFLALSEYMDAYIGSLASTIDHVKAKKRSKRDVKIAFEEWNPWYHSDGARREVFDAGGWPHAPRLFEEAFDLKDVLLVGCILNTFIRRSDVVRIACIAQLVNVIGIISTEPGGPAWRQATYYPFYFASKYGRGKALNLSVDSPAYDAELADKVSYLDVAGVVDEVTRTVTLFAVNRHPTEEIDMSIDLRGFGADPRIVDHQVMTSSDIETANTLSAPNALAPTAGGNVHFEGDRLLGRLAPYSYQMLRVQFLA